MGVIEIMINWVIVGLVLWLVCKPHLAKRKLSLVERHKAKIKHHETALKALQPKRKKSTKATPKATKVVTAKKVAHAAVILTTGERFNRKKAKGFLRRMAA